MKDADLTKRSFTLEFSRAEVTDAQWKQSKDMRIGEMVGPQAAREQFARMVEQMPKPDRFGTFETVRADAADRLWVKTYQGVRRRAGVAHCEPQGRARGLSVAAGGSGPTRDRQWAADRAGQGRGRGTARAAVPVLVAVSQLGGHSGLLTVRQWWDRSGGLHGLEEPLHLCLPNLTLQQECQARGMVGGCGTGRIVQDRHAGTEARGQVAGLRDHHGVHPA